MKINTNETCIKETWKFDGDRIVADEEGERIEWLVYNYLKKVAADAGGWNRLYQDPGDERYWELTFPNSEMHGGGPRMLQALSDEEAKNKYSFSNND